MFDQSYNDVTLAASLRKGDFRAIPVHLRDAFRARILAQSTKSALTIFGGRNPISTFHLKKKAAYKIQNLRDDLVVRKLTRNIKNVTKARARGRTFVVANLRHFLEEGIPYRVYRLDVKSFYESFLIQDIKEKAFALRWLTPLSKRHLAALLDHYEAKGGQGLPRGMGISAVLSEWLMSEFDSAMRAHPAVYFYGRYVDDITIISNISEDEATFLEQVNKALPPGLALNDTKERIRCVPKKTAVVSSTKNGPELKFNFSYLGYQFSIFDPHETQNTVRSGFRLVQVDISPEKERKIKTRIVRSFIAFKNDKKFSLLKERIKFLTSNFGVVDKNTGRKRLAGIYYSYPMLSDSSQSLAVLDEFLKNATLSKRGKLFSATATLLTSKQKRELLAFTFSDGHREKRFIHFPAAKINQIQECWINE